MTRAFSFRKNTSESTFIPDHKRVVADAVEDLTAIPRLELAQESELGFHHEQNEDKAFFSLDLLKEHPPEIAVEYKGTPTRTLAVVNVFDGHGGHSCSSWAQEFLHKHLAELLWRGNFDDLVGSALHHSFKNTENEFCAVAKKRADTAGSCALSVVIKGNKIFCGNAGDSKAIVFKPDYVDRARSVGKVELNERHGTHLKEERARVKAAGGKIAADGSVYGVLFPTRGFGDIDVKADGKPVVICTPTGAGIDSWEPYVMDTSTTTYLVVASDGLWDFVPDEKVMMVALRPSLATLEDACKALIREARMGGSEDDITVVIARITFPPEDQPKTGAATAGDASSSGATAAAKPRRGSKQ